MDKISCPEPGETQVAPKVSPEKIQELLDRVEYVVNAPLDKTSTFVHAYLDGHFYLGTGHSACVHIENFDLEIGKSIAMPKAIAAAREKLWELEGYRLYQRGAQPAKPSPEKLLVALGDQVAYYEQLEGKITEPMVGTVSSVVDEGFVNLSVLAPNGTVHARVNVPLLSDVQEIDPSTVFFARLK